MELELLYVEVNYILTAFVIVDIVEPPETDKHFVSVPVD